MKKFFYLFFLFLLSFYGQAQCAMCKATVESNAEIGGGIGDGLNLGILFLMAFPYLIITTIFLLWRRHKRLNQNAS